MPRIQACTLLSNGLLFLLLSAFYYGSTEARADSYFGPYNLKYGYKLSIAIDGEEINITEVGQTGNHRYKSISAFSYKTVQYVRSLRNQNNANNDYQVAIDFSFGNQAEVEDYTDNVLQRHGKNPRYYSRYGDGQTITNIVNDLTAWIDQQNQRSDTQSDD